MKVSFVNGPITILVELDEDVIVEIANDVGNDHGIDMGRFQYEEIDGYV